MKSKALYQWERDESVVENVKRGSDKFEIRFVFT